MAIYFLDTSALVKLYIEEAGSTALEKAVTAAGARVAVSSLGVLEFRAALRARARRHPRLAPYLEQALGDFVQRGSRNYLRQSLTEAVVELAGVLVDRHPLRSLDSLQLASCVELQRIQPAVGMYFVCSDHPLLQAAQAERIPCWDPAGEAAAPT